MSLPLELSLHLDRYVWYYQRQQWIFFVHFRNEGGFILAFHKGGVYPELGVKLLNDHTWRTAEKSSIS